MSGFSGGVLSIAGLGGAFTLTNGLTNSGNALKLALNNAAGNFGNFAPAGTASGSYVMMGLGATVQLTPLYSSRIMAFFQGSLTNTVSTAGTFAQIRYGTGAAPINGAAATGTTAGAPVESGPAGAGYLCPFAVGAIITGLTPATLYWFDIAMAVGSGTGSASTVSAMLMEF